MKYKVQIGDWSGDGHDKSDIFIVDIHDRFSPEELSATYFHNVERFGFAPDSFAHEYEDGTIPNDKLEVLMNAGLDVSQFDELPADGSNEPTFLGVEDMLRIVMFYFSEDWEVLHDDTPYLIGAWSKITATSERENFHPYGIMVGYGLYY